MNLYRWLTTDASRWVHGVRHFAANGLILPELPAHLQALHTAPFREDPPGCFSTSGWAGTGHWSGRIDDWIGRPASIRAWLAMHPHEGEPVVEIGLVSPHLGLFIRHRWDPETVDAADSLRVQGACRMAGHLLARVEVLVASGGWPGHQRMLVIDDGLDLPRWGWLDAIPRHPDDPLREVRVMRVSPAMYFDAMSALDTAIDPSLDVFPGGHAFAFLSYTPTPCKYPQKPIS